MGDVQAGGFAAQVPQRVVDGGEADDRHALIPKEIQFLPGFGIQAAADARVHPDDEVSELADHLVNDRQATVVDGEDQALAGDALVGVEEGQDAIGGAEGAEDGGQDRRVDGEVDDLGAEAGDFHGGSPLIQARWMVTSPWR